MVCQLETFDSLQIYSLLICKHSLRRNGEDLQAIRYFYVMVFTKYKLYKFSSRKRVSEAIKVTAVLFYRFMKKSYNWQKKSNFISILASKVDCNCFRKMLQKNPSLISESDFFPVCSSQKLQILKINRPLFYQLFSKKISIKIESISR